MVKRIFSLITVVAMMMSLFAISANAAIYLDQDFDKPNLDMNDGTALKITNTPTLVEYEVSQTPDGEMYYYKEGYSSRDGEADLEWSLTLPDMAEDQTKEYVLEYDFMIPDYDALTDSDYIYSDIYFAGLRQSWQLHHHRIKTGSGGWGRNLYFTSVYPEAEGGHEGKWMTFAHHYYYSETSENANKWNCDVYAKPADADEWSIKSENHAMSSNASDRIRFYVYGDYGMKAYFDNIKVYSGENLMNENIKIDDVIVPSLEQVVAGKCSASATVLGTKSSEGLRKILVAYDKTGKMVDCTTGTQNIYVGSNDVSASLTLDDAEAAAVKDGGYVGLYLWDGMMPYINAVELKK